MNSEDVERTKNFLPLSSVSLKRNALVNPGLHHQHPADRHTRTTFAPPSLCNCGRDFHAAAHDLTRRPTTLIAKVSHKRVAVAHLEPMMVQGFEFRSRGLAADVDPRVNMRHPPSRVITPDLGCIWGFGSHRMT